MLRMLQNGPLISQILLRPASCDGRTAKRSLIFYFQSLSILPLPFLYFLYVLEQTRQQSLDFAGSPQIFDGNLLILIFLTFWTLFLCSLYLLRKSVNEKTNPPLPYPLSLKSTLSLMQYIIRDLLPSSSNPHPSFVSRVFLLMLLCSVILFSPTVCTLSNVTL